MGRDPGNDIILRDPKVSRHHAEIVFERGFFVLHDLASANGTYVNAKRVRVAPLTHGAKLRMGNTYGRFSEELSKVLDWVDTIEELGNLDDVPPTSHVVNVENALRADEPRPSLPVGKALESAPDAAQGGFRVPSPTAHA